MLKRLLATSAIVLAMGGLAAAQTSPPAASPSAPAASSGSATTSTDTSDKGSSASGASAPAASSSTSSDAGKSGSAATDTKSGSTSTPAASSSSTGSSGAAKSAKADEKPAEKMNPEHMRASKWIGKDVHGADDKQVGDVKDLILDKEGKVQQVIVSVGGFLGIGEKHVALPLSEVKIGADDKLTIGKTKEQLTEAARFEYAEDRSAARPGAGSSTAPAGSPAARPGAGTSTPTK